MPAMMRRMRSRRGVTLVLTMFMFMIFMGLAAFVADFGRMFLFRNQLHAAADGAALAGTYWVSKSHAADAQDTAISYAALHKVETSAVPLAASDVIPGNWTRATGFVPVSAWTSDSVDAVQVTTRYTGSYTLGKLLGLTSHALSATAIAVRGSVGSSTCTRPWAVPLQLMFNALQTVGQPARDAAAGDSLTATDVSLLGAMTIANNMALKVGDQSSVITSGNFYGVELPPIVYADGTLGNPWSGGNNYSTAEGHSCATISAMMAAQGAGPSVSVGDWLAPENGNMIGPTKQGIQDLCGLTGNNYTCSTPVRVVIALWDVNGNAPNASGCGGKCFHIKYMGVFYVTGYDTTQDAVMGYFQTMDSTGSFSPSPGPIKVIALVK